MKKCTSCKEEKIISCFYIKSSNNDGYQHSCKECEKKYRKKYKKSKKFILANTYSNQKINSIKRNHPLPSYTRNELKDWLFSQPLFHELYDKWVESDYNTKLRPSVDRKEDYKPYTIDNIQITTWQLNNKKLHSDRICGKNNKASKAVVQFSLNEEYENEYYSIHQAGRETKINFRNIHSCCCGIRKTAGGFIWKFKEDVNV